MAVPVVGVILFAPFSAWLDLAIEKAFYRDGQFVSNGVYHFLYEDAVIPAQLIGIAAFLCLVASYIKRSLKPFRQIAWP